MGCEPVRGQQRVYVIANVFDVHPGAATTRDLIDHLAGSGFSARTRVAFAAVSAPTPAGAPTNAVCPGRATP